MSAPYDETFEEFERRTGLNAFFGEYSTEIRGKLLSKNLEKPQNVYDVLYPQVRKDSLSKNISISSDIDKNSEEIRKALLSKQVSEQISLEESGENVRKRNLSKNQLIESAESLEDLGQKNRLKSIAKNVDNSKDISTESKIQRNSNIKRNVPLESSNLELDSEKYRQDSIARNLVRDNDPFNKKTEISEESLAREENLSRNLSKNTSLESSSSNDRSQNLSRNLNKKTDLVEDSEGYRVSQNSKNLKSESNLERDSEESRTNILSKNPTSITSLEQDSVNTRQENQKRNVENKSDLEKDSNQTRNNILSSNSPIDSDLEESSLPFREDDLSRNVNKLNDLEESSQVFREDDLSNNVPARTDLEADSIPFRSEDLSKNTPVVTDLETSSEPFREDDLSNNIPVETNLEESSSPFRQDDLSNNVSIITDLESDSSPIREDNLSNNSPVVTDLETSSLPFREDDLSNNSPIITDLENSSIPFREDDLSNNSPIVTDLETSSEPFREDDLSFNTPINSDLEADSTQFRNDDLSANVSINSDLELDSGDYLDNNISSNVPTNSDLEADSGVYLDNNISSNVPIDSDLEVDSAGYRAVDLSANVPINSDLDIDSIVNRNQNLANNVSIIHDLTGFSKKERDQQLANNDPKFRSLFLTGFVFRNLQLLRNTDAFSKGVRTNVEEVGELTLPLLTPKNKYTFENPYQGPDADDSIANFNLISTTAALEGGFTQVGIDALEKNAESPGLIALYGTNLRDSESSSKEDSGLLNYTSPIIEGDVVSVISLHNIQQNTFQSRPGQQFKLNDQSALDQLTNFSNTGFQELISKTGLYKSLQSFTNSTPESIIAENDGTYLTDSADKILKPNQDAELGTATSMASQTDTSDAIEKNFDGNNTRRRGVRYVIDKIRNEGEGEGITFARNFNVQGSQDDSSVFILGKNKDGTARKSYNRYSIKNPYAAEATDTQSLEFNLTNYAIKDGTRTMSFPPYIKSFQHGDKATWNSVNYLGRPEPIYTYGSSSRDGSVSFVVLTDYATEVDIGYSFDPATGTVTKQTVDFSGSDFTRRPTDTLKQINDVQSEINEQIKILQSDDSDTTEKLNARGAINDLETQKSALISVAENTLGARKQFSEVVNSRNLYKWIEGFNENEIEGDFVESKAEDTLEKLDQMKSRLAFQPSYFSGSKTDFVERMEFLSKLTRPARNNSVSDGFSFTDPPVCHIHLGDWFNHDIIIDSVSYDYSDVPWTLDDGKTYPMWANVTINFNIIGSYGANNTEDAPLATDKGGFFGRRRTSTF